jgi:predicted secreted protein
MELHGMKESSLEPHKISLRVGGTHQLKLEGPGSTGYTWEYVIEGSLGVVGISIEQLGEPPRHPRGGPIPDTYSLDTLFVITALKQGTTKVRLFLLRPWERDRPPLKELYLDIAVSG